MKKIVMILVAFLTILTLTACAPGYTNINNEELTDMLASDVDYYFIDVRTYEEYVDERVPGFTKNIDFYILEDDISLLDDLDTSRPVVIMCNSGNRSVSAAKIFAKAGFDEVYNLTEGIQGWDGETE